MNGIELERRCCFDIPVGVVDPELEKLATYRHSKTGKTGGNASRDFDRYVHKSGRVFPVQTSYTKVPIRTKKSNKLGKLVRREVTVDFPVLSLSSWVASLARECPMFLLGGHSDVRENTVFEDMLDEFWTNFRVVQPDHPLYQKPKTSWKTFLPACDGVGISTDHPLHWCQQTQLNQVAWP